MGTKNSQPQRLSERLKERFSAIVENDVETEGFWETVADHYGVSQDRLTERQRAIAQRCTERVAERLLR